MLCLVTTFIVGGFGHADFTLSALAQQTEDASVFDTGFRGTIRNSGSERFSTTDDLDLTTAEGQRSQLARGEQTQTTRPIPVPLSQRVQERAEPVSPQPVVFNPESADELATQNIAVEPVQQGTTPQVEDDPFAATGFRLGIFEADFSLEQSIGYSSNISRNVGGRAGAFSQTEANLGLVSDWSRHELQLDLSASYRRPFDSEEVDQPFYAADGALRLDLIDGVTLTTSGFYTGQTQEFTSTTLAPGAVDTPLIQNFGGAVELERADRKLQFTLRGQIERNVFEDADLGSGVTVSQEDLNNTEYGGAVRIGYEISPAIVPFVEGQYRFREFDLEFDRNGNRRDSEILEVFGGVAVDLGEKVRGEVSAGFITERFDDPALTDLNGFSVDGQLVWSPERDTEVTMTLGTETNSSITAGESGTFLYNVGISAQRQISDRWAINGFVDFERETNDANNTTVQAGAGLEYWVNRFTALTGDVEYQSFTSDTAGGDFDEVSVRAGVRLQR